MYIRIILNYIVCRDSKRIIVCILCEYIIISYKIILCAACVYRVQTDYDDPYERSPLLIIITACNINVCRYHRNKSPRGFILAHLYVRNYAVRLFGG